MSRGGSVYVVLRARAFTGLLVGAAVLAAACARPAAPPPAAAGRHILCTTFPVFLFTRNVVAGRAGDSVDLMLPAALGCPHDYVLTPQDMQKIATADLLVANGLGLEEFLGPQVARANPGVRVIEATRGAGDILWMDDETAGASRGRVPNPHMFTSPLQAARMARTIAAALAEADPGGAAQYTQNAERYARGLDTLAAACKEVASRLRSRKIVTVHAVFDYFARDCGLEIAAVVEEVPGQEPSAARMLELVGLIRRTGPAALFTEPQYPAGVARTIAREAGVPDAVLDPVASGPDSAPLDYYERVMRENLATLRGTIR